jgi:putative copper export protein
MLAPTLTTVRIFLHVLGAAVWVGGQLAVAGIVPGVRRVAPEATKAMAQGFGRLAWPAFAVMTITGMWGMFAIDAAATTGGYQVTLLVKIALAILSGAAAAVHAVGSSKLALAAGGAVGVITSLGALFLGVLLATGS